VYYPSSTLTWTEATAGSSTETHALCGNFDYTLTDTDDSTTLPSDPFTVNIASKTLTTVTSNTGLDGNVYTVRLRVFHTGYESDTAVNHDFPVTIDNPCGIAGPVITTTSLTDLPTGGSAVTSVYYELSRTADNFYFDYFTVSPVYCPLTYSIEILDNLNNVVTLGSLITMTDYDVDTKEITIYESTASTYEGSNYKVRFKATTGITSSYN